MTLFFHFQLALLSNSVKIKFILLFYVFVASNLLFETKALLAYIQAAVKIQTSVKYLMEFGKPRRPFETPVT